MTIAQIICLIVVVGLAALFGFLIIKKCNNKKVLKLIALAIISILLILYVILWKKYFQLMSVLIVVYLAVLFGYLIITKSKKYSLAKWITLFILVSVALTWIFTYGYFNGAEFIDYGINQQGLSDFPNLLYYSINFAGDKLVYLLALGAFYAVLSRNDGYKKIVNNISNKFKGKEIIFALVASLLLVIMTAFFSQTFIVLIFVPFIISILLNMKLDKITAFATGFGSVLIGNLGLIYGGEGLYWFNYYTQTTVHTALIYRLIVLVIAYILFNLFVVLHAKKVLKDKNVNEIEADPFNVEKFDKKVKSWPIITLLFVLFVILVLGYVAWEANFGITCFKNFHNWLLGLSIGDFAIFKVLFGTLAKDAPFGVWNLFHASTLLVLFSILIALISKLKLDEFIDACVDGCRAMAKPIALFIGTYLVMVAAYMSPFMPTITNALFNGVSKFNPYLVSFDAFIANIFHVDFGYTGYVIGTYFASAFGSKIEVVHIIFTTMYGFAGLFVPTSALMLIGLSYLNIDYKTWIKYIWKFVIAILVILLILFTIMTYI